MGAAASIHAAEAAATVFKGLLAKGQLKYEQLEDFQVDVGVLQLVMLKLGLLEEMDSCDSNREKQLHELLAFSKGEDAPEDAQVTQLEVSAEEDLGELDVSADACYMITSESTCSVELIKSLSSAFQESIQQVKGLNIANNGLDDSVFSSVDMLTSPHLMLLQVGGNSLGQGFAASISSCNQLMILDLSFTENLCIPSALGIVCPQLVRLVVDGCSLKSTVMETSSSEEEGDSPDEETSIFYGLLQLRELSMKENLFDNVDALKGLCFFSFQGKHTDILLPTLRTLWLNDNPFMEVTATRKDMESFVLTELPFVTGLNDKSIELYRGSNSVIAVSGDMSSVLKRDGGGGSSAVGGQEGFENMDREYLAALKGERDVTIVS